MANEFDYKWWDSLKPGCQVKLLLDARVSPVTSVATSKRGGVSVVSFIVVDGAKISRERAPYCVDRPNGRAGHVAAEAQ